MSRRRPRGHQLRRNQLGVAFPSPVVILSVLALAMAAIAYFATSHPEQTERRINTASQDTTSVAPSATPTPTASAKPTKKPLPKVDRSKVYVVVFNNSGVTGLAASVAGKATTAGWQVVGTDNWHGTVPATTVYYPERLKREAKLLATDLGIARLHPAVGDMALDRLTVVLTG